MKFAHIADTHIKNLKYHYEYKEIFKKLYEKLKKEKVDYIIHCGDIAHTKTQLSPEFVELCSGFLIELAAIAPTYIILGNHDGNLKNSNRQDAITPIVEALDNQNLFLLKNSGEVNLNGDFALNVLSVFDRDNWVIPADPRKINIALYHGAISNSCTDLGWVMEHGEDDISIFKGHDFAFLGDIHKTNQTLDHDGRIRYAGSTVQQNHGETNDKGFLVWDIQNKDDFTVKHHVLENPRPFVTIELTKTGRIPKNTNVAEKSRLRLVSNNNLSLSAMKKAVEVVKHRFEPESVTFLNRAAGQRGNVDGLTDSLEVDNLRDPTVQKRLIKEYLKDFHPDEELLQRVLALNSKYNSIILASEDVHRNINWELNSLEWDNLFNYGEENKIDFTKLSGIIGIFGKNYSGKSSIIDSMLYTMYNSTSKNERKNLNIINQNKENGFGKVSISIGNKTYSIERSSEKYIKKLKGDETLEAKTDLNFEVYDQVMGEAKSLNGLTRNDTDKNIRKYFGTLDDFLLTSMTSQLGSLSFISEGSTKRKEILAKFLDLEVFDQKYKLAKEDASDLRGALKRLEGNDFDAEITNAENEITINEGETKRHAEKCNKTKKVIVKYNKECNLLENEINSIGNDLVNIEEIEASILEKKELIEELARERKQNEDASVNSVGMVSKIDDFIDKFDLDSLKEKKQLLSEKREALENITTEIKNEDIKLRNQEKKTKLLKEVPCGSEYSHCKFIKDAYTAVDLLKITKEKRRELANNCERITDEIVKLEPEKVKSYIEKYEDVLERKADLESDLLTLKLKIEKNETEISSNQKDLTLLEAKKQEYFENKEAIENKEELVKRLEEAIKEVSVQKIILKDCEKELLELYKEHGSLEQKLQSLKEQKEELNNLREDFAAYDLFMRCMHSNGISYDIIKRKLPIINVEIAKVLANVVNFEIFFEDDGKRLKMFIKHPKHEPRPLEMGSGAEKTIAAMAIRLAVLSVSSLPKSDVFILDEPGTALDADNMDGFVSILELVKSHFKTVLLISHLDSLKDCVDMQITIDKKDGYASVRET